MASLAEANTLFLHGQTDRAAAMYHELAREGDATAAFNYGYCLWRGIGTAKDDGEAKSFFVYARDLPGGEAAYNLALMYMHGDGVPVLYKKTVEYMRLSANLGCVEAQLYLGMIYTTGFLLEPDVIGISLIPFHTPEYRGDTPLLEGEIRDFEEAEREEDARSFAVDADAKEAFFWFRAAARHDPTYVSDLVAKGQFLYAKCFVDGLGTDFDRRKGERLMLVAGKNGSQDAVEYLQTHGVDPALLASSGSQKDAASAED